MGISKKSLFGDKHNQIAQLAKAMSHPARIAIIEYIVLKDACICADIVDELPLAQPTVSQHLKELKNAGIIKGTIEGNSICYCINEEVLGTLQNFLKDVLINLDSKKFLNCC